MTSVATDVDRMPEHEFPSRYRAAEQRGRRLGRPLRVAARIREVDEELLELSDSDLSGRSPEGATLSLADGTTVDIGQLIVDGPPMREVYSGKYEPLQAMMVRDLYDLLEKVIDRCRDAGNVISHIVLKNS